MTEWLLWQISCIKIDDKTLISQLTKQNIGVNIRQFTVECGLFVSNNTHTIRDSAQFLHLETVLTASVCRLPLLQTIRDSESEWIIILHDTNWSHQDYVHLVLGPRHLGRGRVVASPARLDIQVDSPEVVQEWSVVCLVDWRA